MLDFISISHQQKNPHVVVHVDFMVKRSKDLMIRGGDFYAVWDEEKGLWSTDEYRIQELVDKELRKYTEELRTKIVGPIHTNYMHSYSSQSWTKWKQFVSKLADHSVQLDEKVVFSNTTVTKNDYVSRSLDYPLEPGDTPAFDELFSTLFDDENLTKLMWAIGSVIAGESKSIQKFFVLFGVPGTGKSTALNLIQKLFPGYYTVFEPQVLTSGTNSFAAGMFRDNPLIGVSHEGDLSKVRDNTLLNSIVSHDTIVMNVKYEKPYPLRLSTMLFIATNKPVNITDAASGLIRRLVDIRPTGRTVNQFNYDSLVNQLDFELGGIAHKCLSVFKSLGKKHYSRYKPIDMMFRTNTFFNFVDEYYLELTREDFITLSRIWEMYKQFIEENGLEYKLTRHRVRDEMKLYFDDFQITRRIDGQQYRSVFSGFKEDLFKTEYDAVKKEPKEYDWLALSEGETTPLDSVLADQRVQLAGKDGSPRYYWKNVRKKYSTIDPRKLHYVLPPENLIVVDFDKKDSEGNKSLMLNIEEARKWPPTYAEVSKGGEGLHLHYYYDGDVSELSRIYAPGIEIIPPVGLTAIRRKLTLSNQVPIATINSGLPKKEIKPVINPTTISSERGLRTLILRNLRKEIHPHTKPSIDFINLILEEAYAGNVRYDVSDMIPVILDFASKSSNNSEYCMALALRMKFKSDVVDEEDDYEDEYLDDRVAFFDMEVFPNLVLIKWKFRGHPKVYTLINPKPSEVQQLLKLKLVGYNNRRYDNHILYGCYLGFSPEQLYTRSKRIISGDKEAFFREAYPISYADVYDYVSKKQSLKKWQVELGIFHQELDIPWDEPVPEELWDKVGQYCENDVISLEAVFEHTISDYHTRLMLSRLSGLKPNSGNLSHISKIVFMGESNYTNDHKQGFVYTDLSKVFPGYTFEKGKSYYRDEEIGEGGYVHSKPGFYESVIYMDVDSMHPHSIIELNLFGERFTKQYERILEAKAALKLGDVVKANNILGGILTDFLDDDPKDLTKAIKLILNMVYGYTFARFDNPFRDVRNIDNIVAKRGALFMAELKHELENRGINIIHVKTDSVKIANYTQDDIDFVKSFGQKYGYNFSIEDEFEKMVLTNDAVLVALSKKTKSWVTVGARFSEPYVYKTLFSREPLVFEDYIQIREVWKGRIHLKYEDGSMSFIGKIGAFVPMLTRGGELVVINGEKETAVSRTKGYKFLPAAVVKEVSWESDIDLSYYDVIVQEAIEEISQFCDFNDFVKGD